MLIFTKIYSRNIVYKNDLIGELCSKLYLPVVYIFKFKEKSFGGYSFMDMNMDVKDLFAKLKKNGKGAEKKPRTSGGITGFFEKNPKMKIIIPVILLVISVAVALTIIFTTGKTTLPTGPATPEDSQKVDILPEEVNFHEEFSDGGGNVFDEIEIANAKVTMITENSDGYYTAIIETKKASYATVQVGDHINGSDWLCEDINENGVKLSCNGKTVELKYNNGK